MRRLSRADGRGQPLAVRGFRLELPDFTDCSLTTPEADLDWQSVIHQGGPARAFDRMMPAFGDELSDGRDRQGDRSRPRLLRRARMAARRSQHAAAARHRKGVSRKRSRADDDSSGVATRQACQQRVSLRAACRPARPIRNFARRTSMRSAARTNTCCSTATGADRFWPAEARSSSHEQRRGVRGVRRVQPGRCPCRRWISPRPRRHRGADREERRERSVLARGGRQELHARRWGRAWSPMVELLAARELGSAASVEWDALPQMQISLSTRQHVLLNVGVRMPLTQRADAPRERARLSAVGLVRRRIPLGMVMRTFLSGLGGFVRARGRCDDRPAGAACRGGLRDTPISAWRATTVCGRHRAKTCRSARAGARR